MYTVLNLGYTPSQFAKLNQKERAFIIACIQIKLEQEKKENAKLKKNNKKGGRRKK